MADTLNDMLVRNLVPEEIEYTRREKGGFGVRVYPTGRKTFFYLYRVDGQRRFLNLGEYFQPKKKGEAKGDRVTIKEARESYDSERAKVKDLKNGRAIGPDPVELRKQERTKREAEQHEHLLAPSVKKLIEEYIQKHAKPHKRGWEEDERLLNKDALPTWGDRKARDIKKRDVVLLLERIVERGSPGSANGNFKVIRKMFNFAVQRDILEHSPCDGVVMPAPIIRGDRVLTEAEIKSFWHNLDTCHASDDIRRALRLILLTGQRPGEVIGMHTSEIEGAWWTIPVERSKNKRAHRVYLTATARELIAEAIAAIKLAREIPEESKYDGFIFPCPHEAKVQPIAVNALAHVIRRNSVVSVTDEQGKPLIDADGKPVVKNLLSVSDFTPHDLRRTGATFMSQLGELDEVIDAVLNHTKQGIIRTYNLNRYDREKQQALESWERKLQAIITGKSADNVVSITTAKKQAA
jgi:integrase